MNDNAPTPRQIAARKAAATRRSRALVAALATNAMRDEDERIICRHCGCKGGEHRANDGRCPQTFSWGSPKPFPKFFENGNDRPAEIIDAEIAEHWSGNTCFLRVNV